MRFNKSMLALGVWLLCTPSAWALQSDKTKPIEIEADRFLLDDKQNVTVYTGNVVVTQGSIRIQADEITIYGKLGKSEKIVATGNPVRFQQQPDNQDKPIRGESRQAEYFIADDRVVLINQATLWQNDNTFSSDRIEYDMPQARVKAGSPESGNRRVQVTLEPTKE